MKDKGDPQMEETQEILDRMHWKEGSSLYAPCEFGRQEGDPAKVKVGSPVGVRPCFKSVEDKTYLGVFLGYFAVGLAASVHDDGEIELSHSRYNPAFLVPELKRVVFGFESWWEFIESPEQLREITDAVIGDV